ncbi:cell wall-binding repeat-containing protein [Paenibacillus abyssi]|uniref:ArsR family transcriptional regulator n=1 Tax=Paenibacillus abyssi TaxID=1340531 RepID=A0A917G5Z0_9BACL|nr:cell wall-binding repeat-containing protein [Paenibacillus abyssi]GGG24350.1 hypothetical protein GCM10010916_46090 [Paenibacillus abyssi]
MKRMVKVGVLSLVTALVLAGCFDGGNNHANHMGQPAGNTQSESNGEQSGNIQSQPAVTGNLPWIASKNTTRVNSSDPAQAAVLVSQMLWMATSDMNRPGGVILANAEDWQTVVVSANLIHHPNDGPILFVDKDGIPDVTRNELTRLRPKGVEMNDGIQVMLVGDLDQAVEEQAIEMGFKTDKITADNPAALAKEVDAYYSEVTGEISQSVIVGSMDSMEYTMPAINWVAHMPEPLLYVTENEIPQGTIDALNARGGNANIYLLGPEAVISAAVEEQLGEYGTVVRIAGDDPYKNAIAFSRYKDPATGFGWGITTPGHAFSFVSMDSPELALGAAPFSHLGKHTPLLWTDKDSMPDSVMDYVMSVQPKYEESPTEGPYNHSWLTGDANALTMAAQGEIDAMLEIVSASGEGHGGHGGDTSGNDSSSEGSQSNEDSEDSESGSNAGGHAGH